MIDVATISSILSHPTWDLLIIFFFIVVGFFYGISVGRAKLIAVLFGLYFSQLLFEHIPFLQFFAAGRDLIDVFLLRFVTFVILTVLFSYVFIKTVFQSAPEDKRLWWSIFLLSFLEVGLFIAIIFQLLPSVELFTFSPLVHSVFASKGAFFWWLILPLLALFITMRKK